MFDALVNQLVGQSLNLSVSQSVSQSDYLSVSHLDYLSVSRTIYLSAEFPFQLVSIEIALKALLGVYVNHNKHVPP